MLTADKRDYKTGYKKHYGLYKRLQKENSYINGRRLVLVYSVECGLKYMLLDKWHEETSKEIFNGMDERKKKILGSHNLEMILKELGQQGNFKLPQMETIHKEQVSSEIYHQLYRYCIRVQEKEKDKEEKLEKILYNIACWIEERM